MKDEILKADKPPKHLSREAKRIWRQLNSVWNFEPDALLVLRIGLEAFDRLQSARAVIDAEGYMIKQGVDGNYRVIKHPAVTSEKDARSGFLQAMRLLGLEKVTGV